MVRAKFVCRSVNVDGDQAQISLEAVADGSEENKSFFRWTPYGEIKLAVVNAKAAEQFKEGQSYYVDFTPAE